jgi:hypothetical protein
LSEGSRAGEQDKGNKTDRLHSLNATALTACYTAENMKSLLPILLRGGVALAQTPNIAPSGNNPGLSAFYASQAKYRQQGTEALSKEQAHIECGWKGGDSSTRTQDVPKVDCNCLPALLLVPLAAIERSLFGTISD